MIVKPGHAIVKVYKTPSNQCDQFTVVHYLGTERQRKTFSNLGLAITEAETVASKLPVSSTGKLVRRVLSAEKTSKPVPDDFA